MGILTLDKIVEVLFEKLILYLSSKPDDKDNIIAPYEELHLFLLNWIKKYKT
jgi:hypothetical protein